MGFALECGLYTQCLYSHWRKLAFPFPAHINCKQLLSYPVFRVYNLHELMMLTWEAHHKQSCELLTFLPWMEPGRITGPQQPEYPVTPLIHLLALGPWGPVDRARIHRLRKIRGRELYVALWRSSSMMGKDFQCGYFGITHFLILTYAL